MDDTARGEKISKQIKNGTNSKKITLYYIP